MAMGNHTTQASFKSAHLKLSFESQIIWMSLVVANHIIQFLLILFAIVNLIAKVAMDNSMNQTSSESPH
jgi:hypothetical protein